MNMSSGWKEYKDAEKRIWLIELLKKLKAILSIKEANRKEAPDFDLGALLRLPNDFLKADNPEKRAANSFMLALASVFNDLKGVMWFAEQHVKWRQPDGAATGYNGQMHAMNIQLHRMAVGTIHELMEVMRKSEVELSHPDVMSAISKLSPAQAESWKALTVVAQRKDSGASISGPSMGNFLGIVRNTTAFHYDKTYIMDGYEKWLAAASKTPNEANKFAYTSLGKNAEETRFYFADAATTFLFDAELVNRGYVSNELRSLISAVNQALRFVIANYIFPKGIPKAS